METCFHLCGRYNVINDPLVKDLSKSWVLMSDRKFQDFVEAEAEARENHMNGSYDSDQHQRWRECAAETSEEFQRILSNQREGL